jgi:hypothetical protein
MSAIPLSSQNNTEFTAFLLFSQRNRAWCLSTSDAALVPRIPPDESSGHQDRHQAPALPHIHPLSLPERGRPFPILVGTVYSRPMIR